MRIERGTVVLIELNPTVGHEQKGDEMEAIDADLCLYLGLDPQA